LVKHSADNRARDGEQSERRAGGAGIRFSHARRLP
jgi:hypothetical protein